jgi:hypothetical protein
MDYSAILTSPTILYQSNSLYIIKPIYEVYDVKITEIIVNNIDILSLITLSPFLSFETESSVQRVQMSGSIVDVRSVAPRGAWRTSC